MRGLISRRSRRAQLNPPPALPAAWLLLAALSGCQADQVDCLGYACSSHAYLRGTVEVPEDTSAVDVTFCSKHGCFEGLVDVQQLDDRKCVSGPLADFSANVCATRTAAGSLKLEASLSGSDTGSIPPDGEKYSLEVIDHDSEELLVDEERAAVYDSSSNQDSCHHCWLTEMTL